MPGGGSSAIQSLAYVMCLFIKTIKILNINLPFVVYSGGVRKGSKTL
jgi:hypothetical protein